jgi:hypothetical protein
MFTSKRSADLSALAKGDRKMAIAATQSAGSIEVGSTGLNRWWRVVGGMMMNLALGTLYAWSVFVAPLEKEFHWKRADTSTIFTIAVVVFALTFIVAGRLQDKLGPFWISLTGAVLVSLGFFLCAYTTSLTYLFICFGVIGGLGNGFGYSTPIPVMSKWFPDKRGHLRSPVGQLPDPSLWLAHHLPGPGRDLPIHDRDRRVSAKEPSCRIQARGLDPGCDF